MSIQAYLNADSMLCVPKISAVASLVGDFEANQMTQKALKAMCDSSTAIVDMTKAEISEFQNALIEVFKHHGWIGAGRDCMLKTKALMNKHAQTLPPSGERAQCYTIANYVLDGDESIAERILRDHSSKGHALRHCYLLVDAGAAVEIKNSKPHLFGSYVFLDGSELK